jgi:hypothetical protein
MRSGTSLSFPTSNVSPVPRIIVCLCSLGPASGAKAMLESGPMFPEGIKHRPAIQDIVLDFLVGVHERGHEKEEVVEEGRRDRDHAFEGGAEYDVALGRLRCGTSLGVGLVE